MKPTQSEVKCQALLCAFNELDAIFVFHMHIHKYTHYYTAHKYVYATNGITCFTCEDFFSAHFALESTWPSTAGDKICARRHYFDAHVAVVVCLVDSC